MLAGNDGAGPPAAYFSRPTGRHRPTPRWTAYEAMRFGIEMPDEIPMITQERAYTSPIWYTPDAKLAKKAEFYPDLHQLFN